MVEGTSATSDMSSGTPGTTSSTEEEETFTVTDTETVPERGTVAETVEESTIPDSETTEKVTELEDKESDEKATLSNTGTDGKEGGGVAGEKEVEPGEGIPREVKESDKRPSLQVWYGAL